MLEQEFKQKISEIKTHPILAVLKKAGGQIVDTTKNSKVWINAEIGNRRILINTKKNFFTGIDGGNGGDNISLLQITSSGKKLPQLLSDYFGNTHHKSPIIQKQDINLTPKTSDWSFKYEINKSETNPYLESRGIPENFYRNYDGLYLAKITMTNNTQNKTHTYCDLLATKMINGPEKESYEIKGGFNHIKGLRALSAVTKKDTGKPENIIIGESQIDCLSFAILKNSKPDLLLSTGGNLSHVVDIPYLKKIIPDTASVTLCFDNDPKGIELAGIMENKLEFLLISPQKKFPKNKDFNDDLKSKIKNNKLSK